MTTPTLPSPRIRLNTCEAFFAKLKWEYDLLQIDWSEYHSFNFVITANHLYKDWIEKAGNPNQIARKGVMRTHTLGDRLFHTLRDIANATKHWELTGHSLKNQIVSEVSEPQIADYYAYFIAGDVLYVTVGTSRPSMPEIADMAVKCLDWILNGTDQTIPQDIDNGLKIIFRPL